MLILLTHTLSAVPSVGDDLCLRFDDGINETTERLRTPIGNHSKVAPSGITSRPPLVAWTFAFAPANLDGTCDDYLIVNAALPKLGMHPRCDFRMSVVLVNNGISGAILADDLIAFVKPNRLWVLATCRENRTRIIVVHNQGWKFIAIEQVIMDSLIVSSLHFRLFVN